MTYDDLESGRDFGRYLDVDGDGIPYRTISRHASRAKRLAIFTRGTSRNPLRPKYSEEGGGLCRQHGAAGEASSTPPARTWSRAPVKPRRQQSPTNDGVIYFGSTRRRRCTRPSTPWKPERPPSSTCPEGPGLSVPPTRCKISSPAHQTGLRHRAEPRRPAAGPAPRSTRASIDPNAPDRRCCTTTAPRSPPASSRVRSANTSTISR